MVKVALFVVACMVVLLAWRWRQHAGAGIGCAGVASVVVATQAAATYGIGVSSDIQSRAVKRQDVDHQSFELH